MHHHQVYFPPLRREGHSRRINADHQLLHFANLLEPCSLSETQHEDRRGVRLDGLVAISLHQDRCSIYNICMLVLAFYTRVDGSNHLQTCIPFLLAWRLLPQRQLHHFSNVHSTPSRSPPNTSATMLRGTRIAFHTSSAPTLKSRTCTTTDGRSSVLINAILESVATFLPVCPQSYFSLVVSNKTDVQYYRVPR
jgi:hypothetical protein